MKPRWLITVSHYFHIKRRHLPLGFVLRSISELADTPSYGSGELHAVRRADGNRPAPFLAVGCGTVDSHASHEAATI